MAGILLIACESDQAAAFQQDFIEEPGRPHEQARALADYFTRLASGMENARLSVAIEDNDGTAASQTIACTQLNADAGDTVTVCGVVFTVATSPSSDPALGEFAAITSDTVMGAALAAAINAHPDLTSLCTAANVTGTVTVTMATKGVLGNIGTLATSDATAFGLGAATFASGAVGTIQTNLRAFDKGKP